MFDDFLKNSDMEDEAKPTKKRVRKNIAALRSLIEQEENNVTKHKIRIKPLITAAVIAILSGVSLLSASAAIQSYTVNFFMGGEELEGEYSDHVDGKGFRHITFSAVLPMDEENYAIIYDIDAPEGENVRVITDETDPDFMERLRLYLDKKHNYWREPDGIDPEPEDFGLISKDGEILQYSWGRVLDNGYHESGEGMFTGRYERTTESLKKPSVFGGNYTYDHENNTKTLTVTFDYYVGKQQTGGDEHNGE